MEFINIVIVSFETDKKIVVFASIAGNKIGCSMLPLVKIPAGVHALRYIE